MAFIKRSSVKLVKAEVQGAPEEENKAKSTKPQQSDCSGGQCCCKAKTKKETESPQK